MEGVGGTNLPRDPSKTWCFQPLDHTISLAMAKKFGLHVRIIEHVKNAYKGRLDCFNEFSNQNWKETKIIEYLEIKIINYL
jgi:hypothetical protein